MARTTLAAHLLAGCRKGWFDLPDSVHAATAAVDAARGVLGEIPNPRPAVEQERDTINGLILAFQRGDQAAPDVAPVIAAQRADEAYVTQVRVMRQVVHELDQEVNVAVADAEHEIITRHLAAALAETIAETRALHDKHGATLTAPAETVIGTGKAAGDAWHRIRAVAERYAGLCDLHSSLVRPRLRNDVAAEFLRWPDDPREPYLYGDAWRARHNPTHRPWPPTPAAYLVWVATGGVHPWMPTADQADTRWRECFQNPTVRDSPQPVPVRPLVLA